MAGPVIRLEDVQKEVQGDLAEAQSDSQDTAQVVGTQLRIECQADLEFAAQILREVKGKKKRLEDERKRATGPLNETLKVIRGWFKPPIDAYGNVEAVIKKKIADYHTHQAEIARQELLAAGQASLAGDVHAGAAGMQRAQQARVEPVQGMTTREAWTYEVTDVNAIPRSFLQPNHAMILKHIQDQKGHVAIPGIKPVKKVIVVSRRG